MVNIDLSKVIPSRAHEFFVGFLPGLFFVFSVMLANPDLIARLAAKSAQSLTLGHYATFAIVLFLAFVIGNAFILVDMFIQYLLGYAYDFKLFLLLKLYKWPLRQITDRLAKWRRLQRVEAFNRFRMRIQVRAQVGFEPEWQKFWSCWIVLARRLLKVRYGIEHVPDDNAWSVLYLSLGMPTPKELRGYMTLIAAHAIGWAGLAATLMASSLWNKYYVGFSLFLILNGLLNDYYATKRRVDPCANGYLAIRAILREFPSIEKMPTGPVPPPQ